MGSDILEVMKTSAQDIDGGPVDPIMMLAKSSPVPMNSGIQNVFPNIIKAVNRARLLRPPYRQIAIQKAKEALYGLASIGSEGNQFLREMNTTRQSISTPGFNVGQKANWFDDYLYGDKLKNNPKDKSDAMGIGF